MEIATPYKLPHTAAYAELGPIVVHKRSTLFLSYDTPLDSGETCWTTIRFGLVLATRFTPELCVSEEMTKAYDRIVELSDSNWVDRIRLVANERHLNVSEATKHCVSFLDHHGCFEVAAREVPQVSDIHPIDFGLGDSH